jgi:hypothetical protein
VDSCNRAVSCAGGCIWDCARSYKANWVCGLVKSDVDTQNVKTDTTRLENYFCGIGWNCPRVADGVRRVQSLQFNAGTVF